MPTPSDSTATTTGTAGAHAVRALLKGLRDLLLRFILPIAGLGLVLWLAEEALLALGVHGDMAKMLRFGVLPLYVLMMLRLGRQPKA